MGDIEVKGFTGANNVKTEERFYSNPRAGIVEPRLILNADVDLSLRLKMRAGRTLFLALSGAHSLWANSAQTVMLCCAAGVLYRISQGVAVSVASVAGPVAPLAYEEAEGKVYVSNAYWNGVFDPAVNTLAAWGVALPPEPMTLSAAGSLPAGIYRICYTAVSGAEISGNGPIHTVELATAGGITLLNRPTGALVWCTEANESRFYLVGAVDAVVALPGIEPLPAFLCSPAPYMENLCYAHGRLWGSVGPDIYYSMPFKLGWFRLAQDTFHYPSNVTLIARSPGGLFVGMADRTRFLAGTDPSAMQEQDAGEGSVAGTLVYCNNMPELGWTLGTAEKSFSDVPVWLTTDGIVVGMPSGNLANLTKDKLKMGVPARGASLYRNLEGVVQILASFKRGTAGSGRGFVDAVTQAAFAAGKIDTHTAGSQDACSRAAFTEAVSCTVTRGGVQI